MIDTKYKRVYLYNFVYGPDIGYHITVSIRTRYVDNYIIIDNLCKVNGKFTFNASDNIRSPIVNQMRTEFHEGINHEVTP